MPSSTSLIASDLTQSDNVHSNDGVATPVELGRWGLAIDQALDRRDVAVASSLAMVTLTRLPRHLATYERLLRSLWIGKRWEEGGEWGRRLLQADPGNALAWRAVARAAEERRERERANTIWRRAFEVAPYDPDIRAGLVRTSLGGGDPLRLTQACLGALYLRGYRWQHAVAIYRSLIAADSRRIDFQVNLMMALWRLRIGREAYRLARHLVHDHPLLIMPWVVVSALGDENDRTLAQNPLDTMDPDGEFTRHWLRLDLAPPVERTQIPLPFRGAVTFSVTEEEAKLLPLQ